MLPKIVQDQITRFNRPNLGNIKTPAPVGLMFKNINIVGVGGNSTLQWAKRFYTTPRNGILTNDQFNDTTQQIGYTVLSGTVDGSLNDNNLISESNIEYAIDVFCNTEKSYFFPISCNSNASINIYQKTETDSGYEIGIIAEGIKTGNVGIQFKAGRWITLIICYYNPSGLGFINAFAGLIQSVDSWRVPDIAPPPIPIWNDVPITTQSNSITGVITNVLHWKAPDSKDWAGNGVYRYQLKDTGFTVSQQNQDHSLNGFFLNLGTSTAGREFPAGTEIYL